MPIPAKRVESILLLPRALHFAQLCHARLKAGGRPPFLVNKENSTETSYGMKLKGGHSQVYGEAESTPTNSQPSYRRSHKAKTHLSGFAPCLSSCGSPLALSIRTGAPLTCGLMHIRFKLSHRPRADPTNACRGVDTMPSRQ